MAEYLPSSQIYITNLLMQAENERDQAEKYAAKLREFDALVRPVKDLSRSAIATHVASSMGFLAIGEKLASTDENLSPHLVDAVFETEDQDAAKLRTDWDDLLKSGVLDGTGLIFKHIGLNIKNDPGRMQASGDIHIQTAVPKKFIRPKIHLAQSGIEVTDYLNQRDLDPHQRREGYPVVEEVKQELAIEDALHTYKRVGILANNGVRINTRAVHLFGATLLTVAKHLGSHRPEFRPEVQNGLQLDNIQQGRPVDFSNVTAN